jgi:hypothetical protein
MEITEGSYSGLKSVFVFFVFVFGVFPYRQISMPNGKHNQTFQINTE